MKRCTFQSLWKSWLTVMTTLILMKKRGQRWLRSNIWSKLFLIWLTHGDLKNLDHDKNLSKKQAELLGSRLKGWNLLHQDTEIYFFHNRQNEPKNLSQENDLLFWKDVCFVIEALRHQHYTFNKCWEVYLPPLPSRQWIKMTLDLCI